MRRVLAILVIFFSISPEIIAQERVEESDLDQDGYKEFKTYYEGKTKIREEVDRNQDGKPDRVVQYRNNERVSGQQDRDFDGKMEESQYFRKDVLKLTARDSNNDGKPDHFRHFLQGRNVILEEKDKNYDQKIDNRALMQWDANKRTPSFANNRMTYIMTPGYVTIWREEDVDFDGKIDKFYEKGKPDAGKQKIGKPIDAERSPLAEDPPAQPLKAPTAEDKIQRLNEKYGLDKQ